jgi:cellulose synthase/poly-beta-1,6-N-acetylglucosamine synthase-like glycosyltransferase
VTHLLPIGLGVYMGAAVASYLVLLLLSIHADRKYRKGQSYRDYLMRYVRISPPPVAILAPAKNEEAIIEPSVAALLAVPYPNLAVVIIDDGSKDQTFDILKSVYQLYEIDKPKERLLHKPIKSAWKSAIEPRLTVLRKDSVGTKGDANNAGLEFVTAPYVLVTDVDSTIEPDTIQKLVVRMMETGAQGVGCALRPLNGCVLTDQGVKVMLPRNYWAFAQVAEYLRTFQFRQGWFSMGMLNNISGAAGFFKTDALHKIGGYRSDTPAEDLASTWSLYYLGLRVAYEPSTNIYTQVPDSCKALGNQRKRWARSIFQNLMFPRALKLLVSGKRQAFLLAWLWVFEVFEPFVEFAGICYIVDAITRHDLSRPGWIFLGCGILLTPFLSLISIVQMERCYGRFSRRDAILLVLLSIVEVFPLKLVGLIWRIQGVFQQLTGNTSWDPLPRQQFKRETSCVTS